MSEKLLIAKNKAALQTAGTWVVTLTTLTAGLAVLTHQIAHRVPIRISELLVSFHAPIFHRTLSLFLGLMLIYISYQIYQRKTVAWWMAFIASSYLGAVSVIRGMHSYRYVGILALVNLVALILARPVFGSRSRLASVRQGLVLLLASIGVALAYGIIGFWLLDKRDFGIEFSLSGAAVRTLQEYTLVGNSDLTPRTGYADGFLNSLDFIGAVSLGFGIYSLFRPLSYSLRVRPAERQRIKSLLEQHGDYSEGFLKMWPPDKDYFFSSTGQSAIAYKVSGGVALAVGAPAGKPSERRQVISEFSHFCFQNGWGVAFALVNQPALSLFASANWRDLKVGEDAIVDLHHFIANTDRNKHFRNINNRFAKAGFSVRQHHPPHSPVLIEQLRGVHLQWRQSGRAQWGFLQGYFRDSYLQQSTIITLTDKESRVWAFVNLMPTYVPQQATMDLMRLSPNAPSGSMDFLLAQVLKLCREQGFSTFNLGLAPLAGIDQPGQTGPEERVLQLVGAFTKNSISSEGLRQFKSKFEPQWVGQYIVYPGLPTALIRIGWALSRAMKI